MNVLFAPLVDVPAPKPTNVPLSAGDPVRSVVPPSLYPTDDVALNESASASPTTERRAYGEVVPIPTLLIFETRLPIVVRPPCVVIVKNPAPSTAKLAEAPPRVLSKRN